jgi:hypothetical protein
MKIPTTQDFKKRLFERMGSSRVVITLPSSPLAIDGHIHSLAPIAVVCLSHSCIGLVRHFNFHRLTQTFSRYIFPLTLCRRQTLCLSRPKTLASKLLIGNQLIQLLFFLKKSLFYFILFYFVAWISNSSLEIFGFPFSQLRGKSHWFVPPLAQRSSELHGSQHSSRQAHSWPIVVRLQTKI